MPVAILKTMVFSPATEAELAAHFEVHPMPKAPAELEALLATAGNEIRGIATNSHGPVTVAMLDRLPKLEIIASQSAGAEGIAVNEARRRGIVFTSTSEIVATDVADIWLALLLSVVRRIPQASQFLAEGRWSTGRFAFTRRIGGMKLGIFGLGPIGRAIARRGEALAMEIAYFGRSRKEDVAYRYFAELRAMAEWCDVLAVSAPGGKETHHMVDRAVLEALGREGYIVNIGRGTIIDQTVLIELLQAGRLAGAGLDVLEFEPKVPPELLASDRVVLTPHIGSSTVETKLGMGEALVGSLRRHFGV